METTIRSAENNPLLGRTELEVEIQHEGEATPSEESVVDRISAENDLDSSDIDVEGIYTGFGRNFSVAELKVSGDLELEEQADETEEETEEDDAGDEPDYKEIVSGTISDAKEALDELDDPDYEAALEAEKDNKNRTTFIEWLESQ